MAACVSQPGHAWVGRGTLAQQRWGKGQLPETAGHLPFRQLGLAARVKHRDLVALRLQVLTQLDHATFGATHPRQPPVEKGHPHACPPGVAHRARVRALVAVPWEGQ